ncbi:MAG: translocation/assembly module TamB domain-containing protein [Cyclobacteriaceae bacterium]|nr:translocation/assembly module TamB domain-containing protein [Cyclobacteriaceae bacterium]
MKDTETSEKKIDRTKRAKWLVRFLLWSAGALLFLSLLITGLVQLPFVQNALLKYVVDQAKKNLDVEIRIENISITWFSNVNIKGVYAEDQGGDTLLFANKIHAGVKIWPLLRKEARASLQLEDVYINLHRKNGDSLLNVVRIFLRDETAETDNLENLESEPSFWTVSLSKLILKNARFDFEDAGLGVDLSVHSEALSLGNIKLQLENPSVFLDEIFINRTAIQLDMYEGYLLPEVDSSKEKTAFEVHLVSLKILESSFEMQSPDIDISYDIQLLNLNELAVDIADQSLSFDQILMDSHDLHLSLKRTSATQAKSSDESSSPEQLLSTLPWEIRGNNFLIQNTRLQLQGIPGIDDFPLLESMESGILIDFDLRDIKLHADHIGLNMSNLALQSDDDSLRLNTSMVLQADDKALSLLVSDFQLNTSGLQNLELGLQYENPAALFAMSESVDAYLLIPDMRLSLTDLKKIPQIDSSFHKYLSDVTISTHIEGNLQHMNFHFLELTTADKSMLHVEGHLKNLRTPDDLYVDLKIEPLYVSGAMLEKALPNITPPGETDWPKYLQLKSEIKGSMQALSAEMYFTSSWGNILASMQYEDLPGAETDNLAVVLKADSLHAGLLAQVPDLFITELELETKLFQIKSGNPEGKGVLQLNDLRFKNYTYQPIRADFSLAANKYNLKLEIEDPALNLIANMEAWVDSSSYKLSLNAALQHADLQSTGFTFQPVRAAVNLDASLQIGPGNFLEAEAKISDLDVLKRMDRYFIDSIFISALAHDSISEVKLRSELVQGNMLANFHFSEFVGVFKNHMKYYFDPDSTYLGSTGKNMRLVLNLDEHRLIDQEYVAGLSRLKEASVLLEFDEDKHDLRFNALLKGLEYGKLVADSIYLRAQSDQNALRYYFSLKELGYDTLYLHHLTLGGLLRNQSAYQAFYIGDSKDQTRYRLMGNLDKNDSAIVFSFLHDQVILNYENWNISENNFATFSDRGLYFHEMDFHSGSQRIEFDNDNHNLEILFKNFDLGNFLNLVEIPGEETLAGGRLNGDIVINTAEEAWAFSTDLNIKTLAIAGVEIGDFFLKMNNENRHLLELQAGLLGKNLVQLQGQMPLSDSLGHLEMDLIIRNFDLETARIFTGNSVKQLQGTLTGNLKATGTMSEPEINGEMRLQNAMIQLPGVETIIKIEDQTLRFDRQQVVFNDFTILDVSGNPFILNGNIFTRDYSYFWFELDLQAEKFEAINTTRDQNESLFGKLIMNTQTSITGDMDLPIIQSRLRILANTDLTLVLPAEEMNLIDDSEIIEYVDFEEKIVIDSIMSRAMKIMQADTLTERFAGLDIQAIIELDPAAKITVVIDPRSGDHVSLKGSANLNFSLSPSGMSTLTGNYEIAEGYYMLSFYGLVKKEFTLEKGSNIVWSGNTFEPRARLTAIHRVRAAPAELLGTRDASGQKLPFDVYIKIDGDVLKPDIRFDIDLPDAEKGRHPQVNNRLMYMRTPERENELNKQVFALLVFGAFISDEPGDGAVSAGSMATTAARNSVNGLLSEQLNRLSGRYIRGVDLNFQLQTYDGVVGNANGADTRTELAVDVRKNFFDDRLTVEIAGAFDVEGNPQRQNQMTGLEPNMSVTYKITEDGKYRLRGFRENIFDDFDGELIRTGIAFIFVRDFDYFKRPAKKVPPAEKKIKKTDALKPEEGKELLNPTENE